MLFSLYDRLRNRFLVNNITKSSLLKDLSLYFLLEYLVYDFTSLSYNYIRVSLI